MRLLGVVAYETSSSDDLANLGRMVSLCPQHIARTHLENTITFHCIHANLHPIPAANQVPQVRRVPDARPHDGVGIDEGSPVRRLEPLCDVDLLQQFTSDMEVVGEWCTVGYNASVTPTLE
jgi:hypothetical protein